MAPDTDRKPGTAHYNSGAKFFHYAIALLIFGLIPAGFFMTGLEYSQLKLDIYMLHKSFGMTVFALAILRILWRFVQKPPPHMTTHKPWERRLSALTHGVLYIGIFILPLSGWLMSSAAAFANSYFGLFLFPALIGEDKQLFGLFRSIHEITAFALLFVLGLHTAGALKHHVIDKDITLRRMFPRRFFTGLFGVFFAAFIVSMTASGLFILQNKIMPLLQKTQQAQAPAKQVQTETKQIDALQNSWRIVPDQSTLGFEVTVSGAAFKGTFKDFGGEIIFDKDNLDNARTDITVQTGSVTTTSDERTATMQTPIWLDVSSFPEARFQSVDFTRSDDDSYIAHGTLTLKGVSQPLSLPFTLADIDDGKVQMNSEVTIKRLRYNIGTGEWEDTQTVDNQVLIKISVHAEKAE